MPALGRKLHRLGIPFFSQFGLYQETRNLDLAIFLALFILVAVWWTWEHVLEILMCPQPSDGECEWHFDTYKRVLLILGGVLIVADACLFISPSSRWAGRLGSELVRHPRHRGIRLRASV